MPVSNSWHRRPAVGLVPQVGLREVGAGGKMSVVSSNSHVEDNGAVAEALNALVLEHPGDVIIEPSSYTPDGTPVFTVPPELRASHGF